MSGASLSLLCSIACSLIGQIDSNLIILSDFVEDSSMRPEDVLSVPAWWRMSAPDKFYNICLTLHRFALSVVAAQAFAAQPNGAGLPLVMKQRGQSCLLPG